MKLLSSVSFLAAAVAAVSVDLTQRETPLDLQLERVGNTAVKAYLTNKGNTGLRLLKTGTFLDKAPVEKVQVFSSGRINLFT
jgi:deuterolysin